LGEDSHIDFLDDADINELAQDIQFAHNDISYIKGFVDSGEPAEGPLVEQLRTNIRTDYANNVFSNTTSGNPPKRGIYGEAEILLKPGTVPLKQRPYQMAGERRSAWVRLTDQLIAEGKIEPGQGPWCSPSFSVPKKKPGEYRLVVDYRRLNEATIVDSHPLPRIGDSFRDRADSKFGQSWT
jgi:hypothetical protein